MSRFISPRENPLLKRSRVLFAFGCKSEAHTAGSRGIGIGEVGFNSLPVGGNCHVGGEAAAHPCPALLSDGGLRKFGALEDGRGVQHRGAGVGEDVAIRLVAGGHVEVEIVIEATIGNFFLSDVALVASDGDRAWAKGRILGTVDGAANGLEL